MRISDWSSDVCSSDLIAVDTRIVCATHRDLDAMIAAASFRDDLYYRLAEMVVKIPSLNERPGDAVLLARHFLPQYAPPMNPGVRGLAPAALQAIDAARWPGQEVGSGECRGRGCKYG